MKSFGKILREKRLNLNKTIKQCADDTKISKRFVEGLEEENLEIFPGEAYFVGFLRVYAEYLGLDPEEIVEIYKKQSKIEQPIPYDELTKPLKKGPSKSTIILIAGGILIAIALLLIYIFIISPKNQITQISENNKQEVKENLQNKTQIKDIYNNYYKFNEKKVLKTFQINEGFTYTTDNNLDMHFQIKNIDIVNKIVQLYFIELDKYINLSIMNQIAFDFDNNNELDFTITIENIINSGTIIELERVTNIFPTDKTNFVNYSVKDLNKELQKINILISSTGYSYLKYIIDDSEEKEILLKPDQTFRITGVTNVELHISNLKSINLRINDKTVKLPDQIVGFFEIKWVYNEEKEKYQLVFNSRE